VTVPGIELGLGATQLGFAERLLEVIDAGRRTATYKLALLMALIDLCSRQSSADGQAPSVLYTRDIAEQVTAVRHFRELAGAAGATSIQLARRQLPADFEEMADRVEVTVAAQPLGHSPACGWPTWA
jgi:hypothetical protein